MRALRCAISRYGNTRIQATARGNETVAACKRHMGERTAQPRTSKPIQKCDKHQFSIVARARIGTITRNMLPIRLCSCVCSYQATSSNVSEGPVFNNYARTKMPECHYHTHRVPKCLYQIRGLVYQKKTEAAEVVPKPQKRVLIHSDTK